MDNPPVVTKRPAGRPRSVRTHEAILDAAVVLLEREDYAEIPMERIAAHAKVGKQSIYRWWPSKADLLLEAYTRRTAALTPAYLPSADAFADLEDDLARFFTVMQNPTVEKAIRSLIAEAQHDPLFRAKFYGTVWKVRCEAMRRVLHHGVAMGQIRDDLDMDAVAHVIHGAFWYRLLSGTRFAYDRAFARNVVALLRPGMERRRVAEGDTFMV